MQELIGILMALFIALFPTPVPEIITTSSSTPVSVDLVRVVDGDTILVSIEGKEEYVRYIGIDTPEQYKDKEPECFSAEAINFNRSLLDGYSKVQLVADKEGRDKYNRLLRYVYAGEVFINAKLLQDGYAKTLSIKPNTRYAQKFKNFEKEAKKEKLGLWRACYE